MLQAEEIKLNWEHYRRRVNELFPTRADKLNKMYDDYEERIIMMPASSVAHFHNAFAGGYVDHVLRVMKCTKKLHTAWDDMGADMSGYTQEELLFVALNHDIGKMGFPGEGNEVYIPNDSEWHRKNLGKEYKINPNNPFTLVNDLSIWLLQHYGIEITWNEMLGIKLTDGLYDESNKPYFISRTADSKLKTNLGYVMHQADSMAARIEYEMWRNNTPKQSAPIKKQYPKKGLSNPNINAQEMFKDLFGDK